MAIARALTKRIKGGPDESANTISTASSASSTTSPISPLARSVSAATARRINRAQISLPVTLLSTTNVLAYEAPDIYPSKHGASPAQSFASHNPLSPAGSMHPSHSPMSPLPSVHETPALSDTSSTRSLSGDHSDASTAGPASTAPSSVVASPVISREASPGVATPKLPELNHLSAYFPQHKPRQTQQAQPQVPTLAAPHKARKPSLDTSVPRILSKGSPAPSSSVSGRAPVAIRTPVSPDAPAVPARTRAHTVQTHQALARQRSQRSTSSAGEGASQGRSSVEAFAGAAAAGVALDLSESPEPHASQKQLHQPPPPPPPQQQRPAPPAAKAWEREPHPFGAELAQVKEMAEEFGVRIWDEEEQFLAEHGLCKFGADDYIGEIVRPLFRGVFLLGEPFEEETTWL